MEICCWISFGAACSAASAVCAAVKADPHAGVGSSPVIGNIAMTASPTYFKMSPPLAMTPGTTRSKKAIRGSTAPPRGRLGGGWVKAGGAGEQFGRLGGAAAPSLTGARHDPRTRIAPNIGGKKLAVDPPDRHRFENGNECRDEIANQFDIRFREAAGRVGCPRHCVNDPIREDERRHHIVRDALR